MIVPFLGDERSLSELIARLARLRLAPGDEIIVADNRPAHRSRLPGEEPPPPIALVDAAGVQSPGFARNRAAAMAAGEWLVLIDADTEPSPALLPAYFEPLPAPDCGILAGGIEDRAATDTVAARHAASRGHMNEARTLDRPAFPYAQTANCAIRRAAFQQNGGFAEDARAGEDADLCFRLGMAGWRLESRPAARVVHLTRPTTAALLAQLARHGSGAAWCERRHPGSFPPPSPRELAGRLARSAAEAVLAVARSDGAQARAHLLEFAEAGAFELGRHLPNRARRRAPRVG